MNESDTCTNGTECYVCGQTIEDGEWVVPLETYEARYRGDDFVLNADNKLETILHAECLRTTSTADTGKDREHRPETIEVDAEKARDIKETLNDVGIKTMALDWILGESDDLVELYERHRNTEETDP